MVINHLLNGMILQVVRVPFCFEHPGWIGNLRFLDSQDTVGLEGEITIPLIRGSQLTSGGQDSGFIRFSEEIWFEIPETWKPTWQTHLLKRAGAEKTKNKKINRIPTIHFQVRFVSFREGSCGMILEIQ